MLLSCKIQPTLMFDRKHYIYHDLPQGYQITQHRYPVGYDGTFASIPISRVQLETDTAKLMGQENGNYMLDFNRSGLALVEIVTEPQFESVDSVLSFVSTLNRQLTNFEVIDRDIEDGSFRVDANLNIQYGCKKFPRVEIKNIMGFNFLRQALEFEFARQVSCVQEGKEIIPETRMFCQTSKETHSMREKRLQSYNFIPEHDIPPILIASSMIEAAAKENAHYSRIYDKIPANLLFQLENSSNSFDLFSNVLKENPTVKPNQCINWICNDLLRICNKKLDNARQKSIFANPHFATQLAQIIESVEVEKISKFTGLYLLERIVDDYVLDSQTIETCSAMSMVQKEDLFLIRDFETIIKAVQAFVAEFPKQYCTDFVRYHKGKYCPQKVAEQFARNRAIQTKIQQSKNE